MTETDLKNKIMLELQNMGCKVFNRPTGLFYAKTKDGYKPIKVNFSGHSDLQGHRPDGKCFYLEVKTPEEYKRLLNRAVCDKKTKHDEEQWNFVRTMRKTGAIAFFVCSVQMAKEYVFERTISMFTSLGELEDYEH